MKQKKILLFLLAFTFFTGMVSCKKEKNSETNNTEISTHADDQLVFSAEADAVANDVSTALEAAVIFSPREMGVDTIRVCGGYITWNLESDPLIATITYNGSNCEGSRKKEGTVTVSIPGGTKWKNAGAAVTVTFNDLKITGLQNQKTVIINGTQIHTNVSGGLLLNLASQQPVIHTIASDGLSVIFDNATTRIWKVAQKRTFTYDNGIVLSVSGNHKEGDIDNVAEWGTNRFGITFTTATVEPLVFRQNCNFRLSSGTLKHTVSGISAAVTYGLDASGNPAAACPSIFYYKIVYTGLNGHSISFILPY